MNDAEFTAILNSLTEQFKHRHEFFWKQYFRIFTYQIIILISPLTLIEAGKYSELLPKELDCWFPFITGVLTLAASGVIFWQSFASEKALVLEDLRVQKVHACLKELLKSKNVDLTVKDVGKLIGPTMIDLYKYFIRGLCLVLFFGGSWLIII